jgi:hypothetical protein
MDDDITDQPLRELTGACNARIFDDLDFLAEWEEGRIPWLSAFLRVRQIRRANAYLSRHRR